MRQTFESRVAQRAPNGARADGGAKSRRSNGNMRLPASRSGGRHFRRSAVFLKLAIATIGLLSSSFAASAEEPEPTYYFAQVHADCWSGSCPLGTFVPPDGGADFTTNGPWSTTCGFPDPLPADASIIYMQTTTHVQLCSTTLRTAVHVSLNSDTLTPISNDTVTGSGCTCDGGIINVVDELTSTPVSYHHGAENTVTIGGPGGVPSTLRIFNVDVYVFYARSNPVQLVTTFEPPGELPDVYTKSASQVSTINVPLGAVFSVGMRKPAEGLSPPTPLPTIATLGLPAPLGQQKPISTATVLPRAIPLYGDRVTLALDRATAAEAHHFIAIHLGTINVTLLPVSSSLPPKTVTLNVVRPTFLDASPHTFDEYYSNVAHNSGIPPQYLKGQGFQEGPDLHSLKPLTWRYEICTDYESIGGDASKAAYTNAGFIPFRLDDAIGHTIHPFVQDELDPRSMLWIVRPDPFTGQSIDRHIGDADRNVTAREIWDDNNSKHYRQNWDKFCKHSTTQAATSSSTAFGFVAQTPTASSSGLQQVMWEEAVKPGYWDGVTTSGHAGVKQPKYVFDREDYINIGGGSVQIAANKLAEGWAAVTDAFDSFDQYEGYIRSMFRRYNSMWKGSSRRNSTGTVRYGQAVIDNSRDCPPRLTLVVFQ
jgi:hypothetical protein